MNATDLGTRSRTDADGGPDGRPAGDEPSALEVRYRLLLRLLPRPYRDARGSEMVGTFLTAEERSDPDNFDLALIHGSPSWAERWSIVALALRLRLADPTGPVRYRVRSGAVRRSLYGFLVLAAALAAVSLMFRIVVVMWPPTLIDAALPMATRFALPQTVGLWPAIDTWSFAAWIPVAGLALRGGRRALTCAAGFAAIPTVVAVVGVFTVTGFYWIADNIVTALIYAAVTLLLAALAAAGGAVTARRNRLWLATAGAAAAVLAVIQIVSYAALYPSLLFGADVRPPWWLLVFEWAAIDQYGLWCWGVILAACIIVIQAKRSRLARAETLLGVGYLAGAVLALRLASGIPLITTLATAASHGPIHRADYLGAIVGTVTHILLTAAVTVASLTAARRKTRTLPPADYRPTITASRGETTTP